MRRIGRGGGNGRFALAMARRELRASRRRLALYGSCAALGIASLVGLQGLRASVEDAVAAQSRALLGADLRLARQRPFDADLDARIAPLLEGEGAAESRVTRFGSMALAPRSGRTRLVDVQAVEAGFPFYGAIRTEPDGLWPALRGDERIALVDPSLLVQLVAERGDELVLGGARFRIAGSVTRAPGTFGARTQLAPRVFIARRFVEDTGLVQQGSLVDHIRYLRVPGPELAGWVELYRDALAAEGVRVQTVAGYGRQLTRTFGTLTRYLGLVGLAALALAGVGVGAGMRVFVREKADTVATLRALGAGSREILSAYGLLALALGAGIGAAGAALGLALQWGLPTVLRGYLPVEVDVSLQPTAIATGLGLGLWLTLCFAGGPLLDLVRVAPLRALRRDFGDARRAAPAPGRAALAVALGATLLVASLTQAPSLRMGLAFGGGLAAALALLAAASWGAVRGLRRLRLGRAPYWMRQGIANLFRPRNHTTATVMALGFSLFLICTLYTVRHNVVRQIQLDTRPDRPNLVLLDVQPDQREELAALLAERGAALVERAPLVPARLAAIGGRSVADVLGSDATDRSRRWALGREYRMTYRPALRESETLVAGAWWDGAAEPAAGTARVSLETGLARSLDVGVGDRITWDVQGVAVPSVVTSLRDVDWARPATNFFVVFPPGVLEDAPQSEVMLLHLADAAARAELQRDLVERFPNVSSLDATLLLRALDAVLGRVRLAVGVLALFTVATGLAILIASAATGRHERTRETLLLRTLGASSATLARIVATEAVALGILAALVGSALSVAAAYALARFVFEISFEAPLPGLAALALGTVCIVSLLGLASGRPPRTQTPLAALREAERTGAGAV